MGVKVGKRVTVFAGYDGRSYDLIRKLRLYCTIPAIITIVHIPVSDDDSLTSYVIPCVVIEEEVNGVIKRYIARSLGEISGHATHFEGLVEDGYIRSVDYCD